MKIIWKNAAINAGLILLFAVCCYFVASINSTAGLLLAALGGGPMGFVFGMVFPIFNWRTK